MTSKTKIVQYLNEAHASEDGLVRVLQSQIAMTPRGDYRDALERHLRETREHARKLEMRIRELDGGDSAVQAVVGVAESVIAQALALGKTPIDLLRGSGGEEKVLKNAKDAAATEALEIATYTAIERLATGVGDDRTAKSAARGTANRARTAPGAARAEGAAKGAVAGEQDLPIARYDALNADEIAGRLPGLSQVDLGKVEAYERKGQSRATILERIATLRASEPWGGYDAQNVDEIRSRLERAPEDQAKSVREYERAHKDRAGVLEATTV